MSAGPHVVVEMATKGHLKSSYEVILKDKGGLIITLTTSWSLTNRYAGSSGFGHQRLLKVINQGHLKR